MIKIERKETEKTEQAIADLQKANDNESTYNICLLYTSYNASDKERGSRWAQENL